MDLRPLRSPPVKADVLAGRSQGVSISEPHPRSGSEAGAAAGQAHQEAPTQAQTRLEKAGLSLQCTNYDCAEFEAYPVLNADGVWIAKMWGCRSCGHLFRVHETYFSGRRCIDILDKEKRI